MKISKVDLIVIISAIALVLSHLVAVSMWPDIIPRHFNRDLVATGEVSRFDWVLMCTPIGLLAIVVLLFCLKYKVMAHDLFWGPRITLATATLMVCMWPAWIYILVLISNTVGANLVVFGNLLILPGTLSVIMIASGVAMQFVKPNVWLGLRLETTMKDEDLWDYANKTAGVLFVASGVTIFVCSLFVDDAFLRNVMSVSVAMLVVALSLIVVKLGSIRKSRERMEIE